MKQKTACVCLCLLCLLLVFTSCTEQQPPSADCTDPVQSALRSVVAVSVSFSEDGKEYATANGSAIVYSVKDDGGIYLLTNYHVLYDDIKQRTADVISVIPYGGAVQSDITAELVGICTSYDLALLYSNTLSEVFPSATAVSAQREPVLGERVYAVGNALGRQISVTSGIISAQRENVGIFASYKDGTLTLPLIRTDCALNQGNSGGGLFSDNGGFIGMISARQVADKEQGVGYALPSSVVMAVGEKLMSEKDLRFFSFGATLSDKLTKTEWSESQNRLVCSYNITVDSTESGSIASAFFENGDVLLSLSVNGDTPIQLTDSHHLHDIFLKIKEGDSLCFTYKRDASEKSETTFNVSSLYMIKD